MSYLIVPQRVSSRAATVWVGSIDESIERGLDPYSGATRAAAVGTFSRSGYRRAGNNLDS